MNPALVKQALAKVLNPHATMAVYLDLENTAMVALWSCAFMISLIQAGHRFPQRAVRGERKPGRPEFEEM